MNVCLGLARADGGFDLATHHLVFIENSKNPSKSKKGENNE